MEPYRSAGLACPTCKNASLREFQRRYVCDECQGILIPFDDLISAVEDIANTTQKLAYRDDTPTETTATTSPAPERWRPDRPASKTSVTVAVRRVASARGRQQTVERLQQLAAESLAWADVLRVGPQGVRR